MNSVVFFVFATKIPVPCVLVCRFFLLILCLCIHFRCSWQNRWHKTASLCHRKQVFCLFGMQRIVFPCHHFPSDPSIRMQTLIDLVSFVHTKPWLLLKWMQACFCEVFFRMSHPLPPRAVHQLWVACVLPCTWRAGRGHQAFAPKRP